MGTFSSMPVPGLKSSTLENFKTKEQELYPSDRNITSFITDQMTTGMSPVTEKQMHYIIIYCCIGIEHKGPPSGSRYT